MFEILFATPVDDDATQAMQRAEAAAAQCQSAVAIAGSMPGGLLSIDNGKGLDTTMPVRIASVTKTVTAAAALRLVEQGKLDLDAPIAGTLSPALEAILVEDGYDVGAITLRQLLSHSAGLYSHAEDPRYAPLVFSDPDKKWTPQEQVQLMAEYGDPVAAPGGRFQYSDTGYVLVGDMIERASGMELAAAVRALLGMDEMQLSMSWWEVYEDGRGTRARQYVGGADVTDIHGSADAFGGGGLVMPMTDLVRLFDAIAKGEVFEHSATLEEMRWQGEHENANRYRLGLFAREADGAMRWSHSGFWGVLAISEPTSGRTLAGVTNEQSDFPCLATAMRAALDQPDD
ncbi:serine hydrolase domain-containing protein [Sphingomicrobium sediminis]|uniref:Beta-lactamase family protein n=1 Tax=Sphingomicrobium sediminis TaxID=2950949 RepID=A0A9X2EHY3_9SPHN|nr:serine hydrolase domain-containing protein [Sphingomicrobium sediminis]MCM8558375.1 beta-lactamase family protein [Sphingomicrobium sediminis]